MIEERRPRGVHMTTWLRQCRQDRASRAESLRHMCEERERVWVRARLGLTTTVGWVCNIITGPGGNVIEIYIQEEQEMAMVSVLDLEVQWEVIPDADPEMILESPCGSDDEGEEDQRPRSGQVQGRFNPATGQREAGEGVIPDGQARVGEVEGEEGRCSEGALHEFTMGEPEHPAGGGGAGRGPRAGREVSTGSGGALRMRIMSWVD